MKLSYVFASVLSLSLCCSSVLAAVTTEYRETTNAKVTVSAKFNCLDAPTGQHRVTPFYTGLSVDAGELLVFSVDPNQLWSAGYNVDSNQKATNIYTMNANGAGNPFGDGSGLSTTVGSYSFLIGTLVGSLDDGDSFFAVGTSLAMFAPQAGRLSLYHWGFGCFDNYGDIDVSISILE
ncbi:hypothetical protein [Candidatus Albibeggiatoa sp. nov. BB20]|uniref:hypothetical protein n=1 Tax=Candidatus Albibeggiatoa sp. nov. BB20 TaxID=3162723 RepID=UPI0033659E9F